MAVTRSERPVKFMKQLKSTCRISCTIILTSSYTRLWGGGGREGEEREGGGGRRGREEERERRGREG